MDESIILESDIDKCSEGNNIAHDSIEYHPLSYIFEGDLFLRLGICRQLVL